MMDILIKLGKYVLNILYAVFKLFPVEKNKILFLSRQANELSLDFVMLQEKLLQKNPSVKIVPICSRLDDGKKGILKFTFDMVRSMYHLATSQVCVLDAYWPAVSILNHKTDLTVIQMWHALGKIKQSGYQTLGKNSGRSEKIARLLDMHRNYDVIIAGGEAWNPYYCLSFDTTEDKLRNIGLPRIDHLLATRDENLYRAIEAYPEFSEKEIILYVPTFRRNTELNWTPLLDYIDFDRFALIIKGHPNQKIECTLPGVYTCPEFKAVDLLAVSDYVITDYSAIAIEAAILNKKTYYYLYDYETYVENNGINVSPFDSMPGCAFRDAASLIKDLESGNYRQKVLDMYREKYLPRELGRSTEKLADEVLKYLIN